jgi:TrbL/VirB6 plasmid conjugal transfer protein
MRRLGPLGRWVVALALVALVLVGGGPSPADAAPAGQDPGGGGSEPSGWWRCQTVEVDVRGGGDLPELPNETAGDPTDTIVESTQWDAERRVAGWYADAEPKYSERSNEWYRAGKVFALYCRDYGDGAWRRYDAYPGGGFVFSRSGVVPDEQRRCVRVDPGGERLAEVLRQGSYPGDYGQIAPDLAGSYPAGALLYCYDQGMWLREELDGAGDAPAGMPDFPECITKYSHFNDNDQMEEDRHPSIGLWDNYEVATEFASQAERTPGLPDPALYCRVRGSTWVRFADYPTGGFDFSQADEGIVSMAGTSDREVGCVRVVPHHEMPTVLERGWYPGDYGPVYAEDRAPGGSQLYCDVGHGVWRRGRPTECGGEGFTMIPDGCWGTGAIPSGAYQLDYADDDFRLDQKIFGGLMSLLFELGKSAVQITLWLIGWVYTYDFAQWEMFAQDIGTKYDLGIVREAGLVDIAWFLLIAWAGFTALSGKVTRAVTEVALSFVMLGLATILVANRDDYLSSVLVAMDNMSNAVVRASTDPVTCDPAPQHLSDRCGGTADEELRDAQSRNDNAQEADRHEAAREAAEAGRPNPRPKQVPPWIDKLQLTLHQEFVELPYQYLQWGREVDGTSCADEATRILEMGSGVDGERRREVMAAGGEECANLAEWNKAPTGARLVGAILQLAAGLAVIYVVGIVAMTAIIAKYIAAVLFVMAPFAAVAAVLPSSGRRLAWSWLGTIVQMVLAVLFTTLLLSFILLGTQAVLKFTRGDELQGRWAVLIVVLYTAFFFRRTMLAATRQAAGSLSQSLLRLTPAGSEAADRPPARPGGVDILHMEGVAKRAGLIGLAGTAAVGARAGAAGLAVGQGAGRVVLQRFQERRQARRAMRNLTHMEMTRRAAAFPEFTVLPGGGGSSGGGGGGRGHVPPHGGGPSQPPPGGRAGGGPRKRPGHQRPNPTRLDSRRPATPLRPERRPRLERHPEGSSGGGAPVGATRVIMRGGGHPDLPAPRGVVGSLIRPRQALKDRKVMRQELRRQGWKPPTLLDRAFHPFDSIDAYDAMKRSVRLQARDTKLAHNAFRKGTGGPVEVFDIHDAWKL